MMAWHGGEKGNAASTIGTRNTISQHSIHTLSFRTHACRIWTQFSLPAPSNRTLSNQRKRSYSSIRNSRTATQAPHARDDISQLLHHRLHVHTVGLFPHYVVEGVIRRLAAAVAAALAAFEADDGVDTVVRRREEGRVSEGCLGGCEMR